MSTPENYEDKTAEEEDTIPSLIPLDQTSYESSSYGSINDRDPKFVFVDSNREVLMEIGYLEDKVRLIEALRLIDWDPTFWSLNDEIVDWFNSDETTVRKKIQELQNSIHEKEKILVTTRMNMRQKNKERGVYDPALDLFPDLVEPPNNNEPSNDLSALAATICQQVRDVEAAKIKNLEHEYKLASMDVKLSRLREDLKSFEEKSKHVDVNKHLLAVETQNSMLNEFLNSIIEGIKETTKDIERLDSKDPNVLIRIIKDASDLNYRVISECYPHIESKPGVSQLLWLPHDIKFMGMEEYLTTMRPKEHYLDVKIDWKQRKKDVKEIGETRDQLLLLKRKLKWQEHRIATGRQGTIQYLTEQQAICGLPVQVTNSSDAAPCTVSGITYLHSQQITREDPCDFCLCLDGEVFCWWQQQCLNTTQQQLPATSQDNSTTSASESEEWVEESGHNTTETPAPQESMCRVMGVEYKIGEVLPRETGTCLQCQCSPGARVTCSPKDCTSPDQFHALEQQSLDMFDVDVF